MSASKNGQSDDDRFRDLARRAMDGSERDHHDFVETIRLYAFDIVRQRLDAASADEISVGVAEDAWRGRAQLASWTGSSTLYVRKLITWRIRDYLRRRQRSVSLPDDDPENRSTAPGPDCGLELSEFLTGLENLAAEMRPVERSILHYLIEHRDDNPRPTIEQISAFLGFTKHQVTYAVSKTYEKVRSYRHRYHAS